MLAISLFTDERLTFSFRAIDAISGLTSMVLRSILLSRSRSICSARSYGRLGGLPLGRPVARCFIICVESEEVRVGLANGVQCKV